MGTSLDVVGEAGFGIAFEGIERLVHNVGQGRALEAGKGEAEVSAWAAGSGTADLDGCHASEEGEAKEQDAVEATESAAGGSGCASAGVAEANDDDWICQRHLASVGSSASDS